MRSSWRRGIALIAAVGLFSAGCSNGQVEGGDQAQDDQPVSEEQDDQAGGEEPDGEEPDPDETDEEAPEDLLGGGEDVQDPNDDVEDGVYRGNGVALPVPEGWSLDPGAFQRGVVAAMPEDGSQQLTARAIDMGQAGTEGAASLDLTTLVEGVREQIGQDAETDEEVDVVGADRAHRFTFLQLRAQQEGQQESSATIVVAEGSDDIVGEFAYIAPADDYDEELASLLVDEAGFDPDSEPPGLPQPQQPVPQQDDSGTE